MTPFEFRLESALMVLDEEKHSYSSTQIDINGDLRKRLLSFAKKIPANLMAADGRETKPHITCLYGLHTSKADEVRDCIDGFGDFTVTLGKMSCFKSDEHDVLKIDVTGRKLHDLHAKIAKLDHTDTHPTYKPHLTIAYLKPGKSADYIGNDDFAGETVDVSELTFSSAAGTKSVLDL